jgi:hypothetical protein
MYLLINLLDWLESLLEHRLLGCPLYYPVAGLATILALVIARMIWQELKPAPGLPGSNPSSSKPEKS